MILFKMITIMVATVRGQQRRTAGGKTGKLATQKEIRMKKILGLQSAVTMQQQMPLFGAHKKKNNAFFVWTELRVVLQLFGS